MNEISQILERWKSKRKRSRLGFKIKMYKIHPTNHYFYQKITPQNSKLMETSFSGILSSILLKLVNFSVYLYLTKAVLIKNHWSEYKAGKKFVKKSTSKYL